MSSVRLLDVEKYYDKLKTIDKVSLDIKSGEFIVLVGPSGCGKSTLLRMIAGLEDISAGQVYIGEKEVTHTSPGSRGVSMVFQSYALYPHMTVKENLAFGLNNIKTPKAEVEKRITNACNILQLDNYLDRLPQHLSGGQRQRVAIGRSIVSCADVFLFDEPLSNLDAGLRVQMRQEIGKLHNQLDKTMIYVTHDQIEAMTLADRIVILNQGRVEQIGTPKEVYNQPANIFVAGFIGSPKINIIDGVWDQTGWIDLQGTRVNLPWLKEKNLADGTHLKLGIRPEHFRLGSDNDLILNVIAELTEMHGDSTVALLASEKFGKLQMKLPYQLQLAPDEPVNISTNNEYIHVFSADGQAIRPSK